MDSYILVKSKVSKPREYFNKSIPPHLSKGRIMPARELWGLVIEDTSKEYYSTYYNAWMKWRDEKDINS
jgi:hypothetical protein